MPHIVIEYSANLRESVDFPGLLAALRASALATGVFPLGGIRIRAYQADHYLIADGHPDNAFVHIMVPLSFLTPRYDLPIVPVNINCQGPPLIPLKRCYEFGCALRRACDRASERIAVIATGGISHWPATPDSGKINEPWDREFLRRFLSNDREALLAYRDEDTWRDAGQGGLEIRTYVALAGAAEGSTGELWFYAPIPIFSVGCTIAVMAARRPATSLAALRDAAPLQPDARRRGLFAQGSGKRSLGL